MSNSTDIEHEAQQLSNGNVKVNNWSAPGPAAFDFRSAFDMLLICSAFFTQTNDPTGDVVTSPTTRMLDAIAGTTLLDDVFQSDPTTNNLEAFIADLTGKEAALLVLSGTMGNQVAVRVHCRPQDEVLLEASSHIYLWEAGGPAALSGVTLRTIPGIGFALALLCVLRTLSVFRRTFPRSSLFNCPIRKNWVLELPFTGSADSIECVLEPLQIFDLAEKQGVRKWVESTSFRNVDVSETG